MTKKDYILIGKCLKKVKEDQVKNIERVDCCGEFDELYYLEHLLIKMFKQDNNKFDIDKFKDFISNARYDEYK